jgi:hypothetical protein
LQHDGIGETGGREVKKGGGEISFSLFFLFFFFLNKKRGGGGALMGIGNGNVQIYEE